MEKKKKKDLIFLKKGKKGIKRIYLGKN